jgi:hypothetical protein
VLNRRQQACLFIRRQRRRAPGASCPADAMDVVVRHEPQLRDVGTVRGDVGRDEHVDASEFEVAGRRAPSRAQAFERSNDRHR